MNAPWALPLEELRFNPDGLIPAIAQDWLDGAVLMLAWMNRQALAQTLASGQVLLAHLDRRGAETVGGEHPCHAGAGIEQEN